MAEKMLNFTVGPVMSCDEVLEVAGESTPYFRTPEFSEVMKENEKGILELLHAPAGSRCVFLTSSGTGAMESVVMNVLSPKDKVIVVNGGTFGTRFAELCNLHKRNYTEIKLNFGEALNKSRLKEYEGKGFTAFLVNMCETSSGVLYDMKMIAEFCRSNGILLVVDAISAFLADPLDMEELGAGVVITGSQKALAVQPGISVVALSSDAVKCVLENEEICMYLSLKEALKNGERGQTPYTPAVTILLQINKRIRGIAESGGVTAENERVKNIAEYFRNGIKNLPFENVSESMSNCVTALKVKDGKAKEIIRILKEEYGIWICPNGGDLADHVFRIGHIGYITKENVDSLIKALIDVVKRI